MQLLTQLAVFFCLISSITTLAQLPSADETGNYGWNNRIALIIGGGPSIRFGKAYSNIIITETDKTVQLEEIGNFRSNISIGLSFTPSVTNVSRIIKYINADGTTATKKITHYTPRGLSLSLFISPLAISGSNEINTGTNVDLGIGIGYRYDEFSIFITNEYFQLNQPRQYFIDAYNNKDLTYSIDGQIQNEISITNDSVYRKKLFTSFGIKVSYTLSVAKEKYSSFSS